MLKLVFKDISTFKDIVDAISELLTEGNFVITNKGISFKATDPTMVTLIELFYDKENFEIYELEGSEVNLTISIESLKQFIRKTKNTDKVSFIVDKDNINKLIIDISGKTNRRFYLPILDSDIQQIPELSLSFTAHAEIMSSILAEIVEDAGIISDVISFSFNNNELTISSSNELTSMNATLTKDSEGVIDIQNTEESTAKYSIEYLKKIMKAKKISNTTKISISNDTPAKLEFKNTNYWMNYILAPRVED